ncbi:hypothetical protein [Streptomyces sp. NPDC059970]|uniref:hypothetical protein n=1 Tax=Streptomyces sp. NPDC059970 TaxID=3347019 RepID=UPI0036BF493F
MTTRLLKLPLSELRGQYQDLAERAPSNLDPGWGAIWNLLTRRYSPLLRNEIKRAFQSRRPRQSAFAESVPPE